MALTDMDKWTYFKLSVSIDDCVLQLLVDQSHFESHSNVVAGGGVSMSLNKGVGNFVEL
jgi:hypothetical protein